MKEQNGFGLIALLVSMAIAVFVFIGVYSNVSTDNSIIQNVEEEEKAEKRSILENQLNSFKKAEESKKIIEKRNRDILNIENY